MIVDAFHLEFKAPVSDLPRAPSIYGQLAWWVRYSRGEVALLSLLEEFKTQPPFLLTSAFPTDFLPRPLLPPLVHPRLAETTVRKGLKAVRYLPVKTFAEVVRSGSEAVLLDLLGQEDSLKQPSFERLQRTRVGISRVTGGAETGILFTDETIGLPTLSLYAVCNSNTYTSDWLFDALQHLGHQGFGGRTSIGLGKFTVTRERNFELPESTEPTAYTTLAPCLAQPDGWYALETHWGRLGQHFSQAANPFKQPYLRAIEGSTFRQAPVGQLLDTTPSPPPQPGRQIYDFLFPFSLGVKV